MFAWTQFGGRTLRLQHYSASVDLIALARAPPEDRDAVLLRAATGLFCQEPVHDRDAIRRFEQLAVHLLPKAAADDRAYIASLLGGRADAPVAVVRQLARDGIGVAGPVLRHSPVLSAIDLLGVISATGPDHHRLIAGRTDLSAEVLRALAVAREGYQERPSTKPTDHPMGSDPTVDLKPEAAHHSPRRAEPIPDYTEFLIAPRDRRLRLLGEAANRRWQGRIASASRPFDQALQQRFGAAGIVAAARKRDRSGLIGGFSNALAIDTDIVARLLDDRSGEPLVLMIRAAGLTDADGRTVLLLTNDEIGQSVSGFFRLAELLSSVEIATAESFMDVWRGPAEPAKIEHASVFADNPTRRRGQTEPAKTTELQRRQAEQG